MRESDFVCTPYESVAWNASAETTDVLPNLVVPDTCLVEKRLKEVILVDRLGCMYYA